MPKQFAVLACLLVLLPVSAIAATVKGTLVDAQDGRSLPHFRASYRYFPEGKELGFDHVAQRPYEMFATDGEGRFELNIPHERFFLRIGFTGVDENPKYPRLCTQQHFWRGGINGDTSGLVAPVVLFPLPVPGEEGDVLERGLEALPKIRKRLPRSTISGVVIDQAGKPVEGIRVTQHRSYKNAYMTTDAQGRFILPDMLPGLYYLSAGGSGCVSADGKEPITSIVMAPVYAGKRVEITLQLHDGYPTASKVAGEGNWFGPAGITSTSGPVDGVHSLIAPGCYRVGGPSRNQIVIFFP